MGCVIRNLGTPYRFKGALLVSGESQLNEAIAWDLLNKFSDGKVAGELRFELVSGTPRRAVLPPRKYLTRTTAHRAMRIPDASDLQLPAPIPAKARQVMAGAGWEKGMPEIIETTDAAPLALWLALSGYPERAQAVLAAVVVG